MFFTMVKNVFPNKITLAEMLHHAYVLTLKPREILISACGNIKYFPVWQVLCAYYLLWFVLIMEFIVIGNLHDAMW